MGGMCSSAFFPRLKQTSPINKRVGVIAEEANTEPNAPILPSVPIVNQYSYKELEIATDNFNVRNIIGEGGFGPVYKGRLKDATLVAIKVLSARSEQGMPEFLKEIEVLSGLHHVNLVKLHGCCTEGRHRMLVYGYVENNSLAQTLLGENCDKHMFSWDKRSRICVGLAKGFAFLHEEAEPRIVHRDIKPSNVLLEEDFTPKISDFGLSRIFPNSRTHITTLVAGTYGYLAPEYVFTGKLSTKADVYSFGVLLLEIVIGSREAAEEQYLPARAWKLYKRGRLEELVDETLKQNSNLCDIDEACRYLKIGLLCTQERAGKRPAMSVVAKMLNGDIDVDNIKIPKPGKLMALLALASSSCEPRSPLLWSCFCGI